MKKAAFSLVLFLLYFYFALLFSPWLLAKFVADHIGSRIGWSVTNPKLGELQHA